MFILPGLLYRSARHLHAASWAAAHSSLHGAEAGGKDGAGGDEGGGEGGDRAPDQPGRYVGLPMVFGGAATGLLSLGVLLYGIVFPDGK